MRALGRRSVILGLELVSGALDLPQNPVFLFFFLEQTSQVHAPAVYRCLPRARKLLLTHVDVATDVPSTSLRAGSRPSSLLIHLFVTISS